MDFRRRGELRLKVRLRFKGRVVGIEGLGINVLETVWKVPFGAYLHIGRDF